MNFQNSEMTCHFSSSLRLDPSLVCDVSWGIDLRSEKHRETEERKKSLSGVCSMGVLLQINIFADFKLFVSEGQIKEISRPETSDELHLIAQASH